MTPPPPEPFSHPNPADFRHSRWISLIALITLGQWAVIRWFAREPIPLPYLGAPRPLGFWDASGSLTAQWTDSPLWSNPYSFASDDSAGFSQFALSQTPSIQPATLEWKTEPVWLNGDGEPSQISLPSPKTRAPDPIPLETGLNFAFEPVPPGITSPQSALTFDAQLAHRTLLNPPTLPAWRSNELLNDAIVEVAVETDGRVFLAHLLESSSNPKADAEALRIARSFHFKPAPSDPARPAALHWGRAIFRWQILPLTPTSTPATLPQSESRPLPQNR